MAELLVTMVGSGFRIVGQIRAQPTFGFREVHALAGRIVLDLVAIELADREIARCGMRKLQPADRRGRHHGLGFGQPNAGLGLDIEQFPEQVFFGVVG